jgi:D-alanyl-D-alanine dipeptidase
MHSSATASLALLLIMIAQSARAQAPVPAGFVDAAAVVEGLVVDMRYFGTNNFVGEKIDGYERPRCLLSAPAANALAAVQRNLAARGLGLKVLDCYRPARAVAHFIRWAKNINDVKRKAEYYPDIDKRDLFKLGYLATRSGHSRGSTVDLTLVKLPPRRQERYRRGDRLRDCAGPVRRRFRDNTIDMGTGYDCFDPVSHPYNARIRGKQRANRLKLREPMIAAGFKGLETEWWHFTLKSEPYPETFFDFPVEEM